MFTALLLSPTFATFLLTCVVLAITPGPDVLYILTRTLSQGRGAGLASVVGVATGSMGNGVVASLGLAIVVAQSATAFTLVKFAGAAYLIFLGVQSLRAPPTPPAALAPATDAHRTVEPLVSRRRIFRDGCLVALLNPKTALFYAALLPQFIVPGAAALPQTLVLAGLFVAVGLCTDTAYVMAAATLAPRLRTRLPRKPCGRYLSAATYLGLGLYAAIASPRATPPTAHAP